MHSRLGLLVLAVGSAAIPDHQPGQPYFNRLPVVTLASDTVTFPVSESDQGADMPESVAEPWERWNDYGIGLLVGGVELRQAVNAFQQVFFT